MTLFQQWLKSLFARRADVAPPYAGADLLRTQIDVPAAPLGAKAKYKMRIHARVYRASTGQWEDLGTISESEGER